MIFIFVTFGTCKFPVRIKYPIQLRYNLAIANIALVNDQFDTLLHKSTVRYFNREQFCSDQKQYCQKVHYHKVRLYCTSYSFQLL